MDCGQALAPRLADTKAAGEVRVMNDFMKLLRSDPDRAMYGPKHVRAAVERGAVDRLLISDTLLRAADPAARRGFVQLTEDVAASGGTVHEFSSMHASGEALDQITGIAAILRFGLPDLDDAIEAEAVAAATAAAAASGEAGDTSRAEDAAAATASAGLSKGNDGRLRLDDDVESVTTAGSSDDEWAFEEA